MVWYHFTFRVSLENRDRNLESGVMAECRCFDSVWQPPGAIQSQILKRIEQHSYMNMIVYINIVRLI